MPKTMIEQLSPSRKEYTGRINRVLDAIDQNLARAWRVEDMASVAAFSPYHFHRIFKALMAENMAAYVLRLRLEKAANRLIHCPGESVTQIALDYGFCSSAHFARAFKAHFGASATTYRGQHESKARPHDEGTTAATKPQDLAPIDPRDVTLVDLAPRRVIYLRHIGSYRDASLTRTWERMMRWAAARDLIGPETELLGIPHDDPEITAPEHCRYDLALVNDSLEPAADFGATHHQGGRYAQWQSAVREDEIGLSWDRLYSCWLPDSGFIPDDRPCLELYGDGSTTPLGHYVIRFCLPVTPL